MCWSTRRRRVEESAATQARRRENIVPEASHRPADPPPEKYAETLLSASSGVGTKGQDVPRWREVPARSHDPGAKWQASTAVWVYSGGLTGGANAQSLDVGLRLGCRVARHDVPGKRRGSHAQGLER